MVQHGAKMEPRWAMMVQHGTKMKPRWGQQASAVSLSVFALSFGEDKAKIGEVDNGGWGQRGGLNFDRTAGIQLKAIQPGKIC